MQNRLGIIAMLKILFSLSVTVALLLPGCIGGESPSPADICLQGHDGLFQHKHSQLTIIIEGNQAEISTDIGITRTSDGDVSCMRVTHTHDGSGKLHLESTEPLDITLSIFFVVWDEPFSKSKILDKRTDSEHEIVMTVDGDINIEYGSLILDDRQSIIIEYRSK